jgi:hypothetical protein
MRGPDGRTLAFAVIALAATVGLALRMMVLERDSVAQSARGARAELIVGEKLAGATIESLEDGPRPGIRIRAERCEKPVYAVPLTVSSVARLQVADLAYGHLEAYRKLDVYDGAVRSGQSRTQNLIDYFTRSLLRTRGTNAHLYLRLYLPEGCEVRDDDLVRWANEILPTGNASRLAGEPG